MDACSSSASNRRKSCSAILENCADGLAGNGPVGVRILLFIPMALRMPDSESTLDSEKTLHELLLLWESVCARPGFARRAWLRFEKIVGSCWMSLSHLHYAFKIVMPLGSRQARGCRLKRGPSEHRELTMVRDPHIECRTAGHHDHFQAQRYSRSYSRSLGQDSDHFIARKRGLSVQTCRKLLYCGARADR